MNLLQSICQSKITAALLGSLCLLIGAHYHVDTPTMGAMAGLWTVAMVGHTVENTWGQTQGQKP